MIVVKIELHSAKTGQITLLGQSIIYNRGVSSDGTKGNYNIHVGKKGANLMQAMSKPLRAGSVNDYPRKSYSIWRLVIRALKSAFPEEN